MRKCCVPGCFSNHNKPYVPTFVFPKDEKRRKLWEKCLGTLDVKISGNIGVCVKHFETKYIVHFKAVLNKNDPTCSPRKKVKLRTDAYPTIIEPPSDDGQNNIPAMQSSSSPRSPNKGAQPKRARKRQTAGSLKNLKTCPTAKVGEASESVLLNKPLQKPKTTIRPIITVLKAEDMETEMSSNNDIQSPEMQTECLSEMSEFSLEPNSASSIARSMGEDRMSSPKERTPKKRSPSVGSNSSNGSSEATKSLSLQKRRKMEKHSPLVIGKKNDCYCWICHKEGVSLSCFVCPRAYHMRCAGESEAIEEDWACPECRKITNAESVDSRSKVLSEISLEKFCMLLKCCISKLRCRSPAAFHQPVPVEYYSSYLHYVIRPMDLGTIEKNVKAKMYGCTESFLADIKWIQHNSCVFNGPQHPLSVSAKSLVKSCEADMAEIEVCPDCFLHAATRNKYWFSELCRKPHPLVWAKLKGFPYWPAKVVRIQDCNIDARFFGAHDRAWVPVAQCYHLSKEMPTTSKPKKKGNYDVALEELSIHVAHLERKYGKFEYAPYRTPFDPDNKVFSFHGIDIEKISVKEEPSTSSTNDFTSESSYEPQPSAACSDSESNIKVLQDENEISKEARARVSRSLSFESSSESQTNDSSAAVTPKKNVPSGVFEISKEKDQGSDFDIKDKILDINTPSIPVNGNGFESTLKKLRRILSMGTDSKDGFTDIASEVEKGEVDDFTKNEIALDEEEIKTPDRGSLSAIPLSSSIAVTGSHQTMETDEVKVIDENQHLCNSDEKNVSADTPHEKVPLELDQSISATCWNSENRKSPVNNIVDKNLSKENEVSEHSPNQTSAGAEVPNNSDDNLAPPMDSENSVPVVASHADNTVVNLLKEVQDSLRSLTDNQITSEGKSQLSTPEKEENISSTPVEGTNEDNKRASDDNSKHLELENDTIIANLVPSNNENKSEETKIITPPAPKIDAFNLKLDKTIQSCLAKLGMTEIKDSHSSSSESGSDEESEEEEGAEKASSASNESSSEESEDDDESNESSSSSSSCDESEVEEHEEESQTKDKICDKESDVLKSLENSENNSNDKTEKCPSVSLIKDDEKVNTDLSTPVSNNNSLENIAISSKANLFVDHEGNKPETMDIDSSSFGFSQSNDNVKVPASDSNSVSDEDAKHDHVLRTDAFEFEPLSSTSKDKMLTKEMEVCRNSENDDIGIGIVERKTEKEVVSSVKSQLSISLNLDERKTKEDQLQREPSNDGLSLKDDLEVSCDESINEIKKSGPASSNKLCHNDESTTNINERVSLLDKNNDVSAVSNVSEDSSGAENTTIGDDKNNVSNHSISNTEQQNISESMESSVSDDSRDDKSIKEVENRGSVNGASKVIDCIELISSDSEEEEEDVQEISKSESTSKTTKEDFIIDVSSDDDEEDESTVAKDVSYISDETLRHNELQPSSSTKRNFESDGQSLVKDYSSKKFKAEDSVNNNMHFENDFNMRLKTISSAVDANKISLGSETPKDLELKLRNINVVESSASKEENINKTSAVVNLGDASICSSSMQIKKTDGDLSTGNISEIISSNDIKKSKASEGLKENISLKIESIIGHHDPSDDFASKESEQENAGSYDSPPKKIFLMERDRSSNHNQVTKVSKPEHSVEKLKEIVQSQRETIRLFKLKVQKMEWYHTQEMAELRHNMNLTLMEMRASLELNRKAEVAAVEAMKKQHQKEIDKAVSKTKEKQWCATCKKAALFYCCWSTSYCSRTCQKHHWPLHRFTCPQIKPPLLKSPNEFVKIAKRSTVKEIANPGGSEKKLVCVSVRKDGSQTVPLTSQSLNTQVANSQKVQFVSSKPQFQLVSSSSTAMQNNAPVQLVLTSVKSGDSSLSPGNPPVQTVGQDSTEIITKVRSRQTNLNTAIQLINMMNKETEETLKKKQSEVTSESVSATAHPVSENDSISSTAEMGNESTKDGTNFENDAAQDDMLDESLVYSNSKSVPFGRGIEINEISLKNCLKSGKASAMRLTRALVDTFFPDLGMLANGYVYEWPVSDENKETKPNLPEDIVEAILDFVLDKFPTAKRSELLLIMNLQCKEALQHLARYDSKFQASLKQINNANAKEVKKDHVQCSESETVDNSSVVTVYKMSPSAIASSSVTAASTIPRTANQTVRTIYSKNIQVVPSNTQQKTSSHLMIPHVKTMLVPGPISKSQVAIKPKPPSDGNYMQNPSTSILQVVSAALSGNPSTSPSKCITSSNSILCTVRRAVKSSESSATGQCHQTAAIEEPVMSVRSATTDDGSAKRPIIISNRVYSNSSSPEESRRPHLILGLSPKHTEADNQI